MSGEPYWYVVPYDEPQRALDALREREFRAGRYYPVVAFPAQERSAEPGAQHGSIAEALEAAQETGTRSILDIARIGATQEYCEAAPFDDEELLDLCDTLRPSRELALERMSELLDCADRGMARYLLLYVGERPSEILFLGYSFD
jgi:hypothetical protein